MGSFTPLVYTQARVNVILSGTVTRVRKQPGVV